MARLALDRAARAATASAEPGPGVELLVTLATPHQGTELATAVVGLGRSGLGAAFVERLGEVTDVPATSVAVGQLSETSDVVAELGRPVPHGVRLLSIGASGDLIVPAGRTTVPGATNVIVHVGGLHAHDQLPGLASVTREIGLAQAGLGPTCVPWSRAVSDAVVAHGIARAETAAGLAIAGLLGP